MTGSIALFDVLLRGGALTAILLVALKFAGLRSRKAMSLVCLSVGLSAYVLVSSPSFDPGEGVAVLAGLLPVLTYWAGLEIFEEDPRFSAVQIGLMGSVAAAAVATHLAVFPGQIRGLLVLALLAHLLWRVVIGDRGDLLSSRRRFRRIFVLVVVLLGLLITVFEVAEIDRTLPHWVFTLHALAIWLLSTSFLLWSSQIRADIWVKDACNPPQQPRNPAQGALIRRIEDVMADGLWRQEGLTIATLARHVAAPEHRVRAAINAALGYRNFASFVNQYRIEEAKALLRDPAALDRTILSIAYEVGFASLGPFNRAFRAQTSMTPTEFRKNGHPHGLIKDDRPDDLVE